ncbi:MAG: mannose-6-phosphate isomerase, class I [Saprospiraceae bacterium]|nr:mannose-6-phosphate isomerase, class I [Saprospiraceae bacterium]
MQAIIPLNGVVQHYDWGGFHFLPQLLSTPNAENQPFAELWMGTHKKGTATARLAEGELSLAELINQDPVQVLGKEVATYFKGRLPFLFKILDVRKMLSIQAHPTKQSAEVGYQQENEKGIALDAFHRNYRDDNHKPEVMVALTDFWLLHGFQSQEAIAVILKENPAFQPLQAVFADQDIKVLYQHIMELPQDTVDEILAPLKEHLDAKAAKGALEKSSPDYWAKLAFEDYTRDGHYDRGIFSIYLFNLVFIPKGKGIFQDAGVPHAYLEGVNVELMANSDNVFRGGLTPKHIDVPELLKHLVFTPVVPKVLDGEKKNPIVTSFATPAPDFALSRLHFTSDHRSLKEEAATTATIYIVMDGTVEVASQGKKINFQKGAVFLIPAQQSIDIQSEGEGLLFAAKAGM